VKTLSILMSLFLLLSCTTGERVSKVRPGMSRADVEKALGRADGFKMAGEYVALKYINRLISGWSYDRTDYVVILKNDKVVEVGNGEVRVNEVGGVQTIFLYHLN
jgi:hypothetical protein